MSNGKEKKTNNKDIPDYSSMDRKQVPEDLTWKIKDIYADVAAWESDKQLMFNMQSEVDQMVKGWTDSAENVFRLLDHITRIELIENRTYAYTSMLSDTDMGNSRWQAMKGEMHSAAVNFAAKLSFIAPDIIKLGRNKIDRYMETEPRLKVYAMDFDGILRRKQHTLSPDKERIIAQTGLFSGTSGKASNMLRDVDMPSPRITLSDGTRILLNTSNYVRYRESSEQKDRSKVMRTRWKHHANFRNTHATLLDGAMKSHFFNAQVHNFKSCLQAALFSDNIAPKVYHNLIETVEDNLAPLHRYLTLKGKMLGLDQMTYDDIYASSVPSVNKTFTIQEAEQLVMDSLKPIGDTYAKPLAEAFKSGWMDIYPNKNKRSGAYSNGSVYDVHPYVLMNYNGTFSHVSTLTHEFGHAMHSWFSNKTQPFPMSRYPIFLAEVASTFNETLLVHYMTESQSKTNSEEEDWFTFYILDRYLEDLRGTLYRQTLFAHFELAMHERVEQGQTLTPDWLDKEYLEITRRFYGHKKGVVKVNKYIENEWSSVPHFYYNFYVYQYSTGITAATTLANMVLNGGNIERERYLNFLKSGNTKYPLDTLKEAGVDLTSPHPIREVIKTFDSVTHRMEAIWKRLNSS
jgi:oligoendopeptidase F